MTRDYVSVAGAIIVGAGESRRMGGVDKLFLRLGDKPLLAHAVQAFQSCPAIGTIILVLAPTNLQRGRNVAELVQASKVAAVVPGGARRQDSVRAGLQALGLCATVVIHDAARPLVTADLIERCIQAAEQQGAAVAAVPAHDTLKKVTASGRIERTLDRSRIWLAQTPQAFRRELIERAHAEIQEDVTDDAMMVERLGWSVFVVPGDPTNLKVTTPADVVLAEAILAARRATSHESPATSPE